MENILLIFVFVKGSKRGITVATGVADFTAPVATVNLATMA
jgi:hypothetical protein